MRAQLFFEQPEPRTSVAANNEVTGSSRFEVPALRKKVEDAIERLEETKEIIKEEEEDIEKMEQRGAKSLVNTFPFNNHGGSSSGHHGASSSPNHHQRQPSRSSSFADNRMSRQENRASSPSIDIGAVAAAGERCIDKVIMVEETEYDEVIECDHSYSEHCFTTYKTAYTPQQEEECEENYKKDCFIEFKKQAIDETVQFCFTPLVRNCNIPGPTECTTEYRSECSTR